MKLIIDIPDEDYNECKFRKDLLSLGGEPTDLTFNMRIETLIANGIPLENIKSGIEEEKDCANADFERYKDEWLKDYKRLLNIVNKEIGE